MTARYIKIVQNVHLPTKPFHGAFVSSMSNRNPWPLGSQSYPTVVEGYGTSKPLVQVDGFSAIGCLLCLVLMTYWLENSVMVMDFVAQLGIRANINHRDETLCDLLMTSGARDLCPSDRYGSHIKNLPKDQEPGHWRRHVVPEIPPWHKP